MGRALLSQSPLIDSSSPPTPTVALSSPNKRCNPTNHPSTPSCPFPIQQFHNSKLRSDNVQAISITYPKRKRDGWQQTTSCYFDNIIINTVCWRVVAFIVLSYIFSRIFWAWWFVRPLRDAMDRRPQESLRNPPHHASSLGRWLGLFAARAEKKIREAPAKKS